MPPPDTALASLPDLVGVAEAGDLLGISRPSVYVLVDAGRLVKAGPAMLTMASVTAELDRRGLPVPTDEGLRRIQVKAAETAAGLGVKPSTVWRLKTRGRLRLADLGRIDPATAHAEDRRVRGRRPRTPPAPPVPERARQPTDLSVDAAGEHQALSLDSAAPWRCT